ncbi:MAG: hypothetical protein WA421_01190 [Nitrososphaeraceae archaeon]|jgi:hypothetical protein
MSIKQKTIFQLSPINVNKKYDNNNKQECNADEPFNISINGIAHSFPSLGS